MLQRYVLKVKIIKRVSMYLPVFKNAEFIKEVCCHIVGNYYISNDATAGYLHVNPIMHCDMIDADRENQMQQFLICNKFIQISK